MNERLGFWMAPLAAAAALVPFFSLPASPWFLGRLTGEPAMAWPAAAAMGVILDATILGYVMTYTMTLPIYFGLKAKTRMSLARVMLLFCLTGIAGSQVVHALQNFRQPALRAFASGWLPPVFGCLCGAVAGLTFLLFRKVRIPETAQPFVYAAPAFTVILCGFLLVNHAHR
jgi:hypothetical protein